MDKYIQSKFSFFLVLSIAIGLLIMLIYTNYTLDFLKQRSDLVINTKYSKSKNIPSTILVLQSDIYQTVEKVKTINSVLFFVVIILLVFHSSSKQVSSISQSTLDLKKRLSMIQKLRNMPLDYSKAGQTFVQSVSKNRSKK